MSRKVNRARYETAITATTVAPTSVAGIVETIVLATPKATVHSIRKARRAAGKDLSWLLDATSSVEVYSV